VKLSNGNVFIIDMEISRYWEGAVIFVAMTAFLFYIKNILFIFSVSGAFWAKLFFFSLKSLLPKLAVYLNKKLEVFYFLTAVLHLKKVLNNLIEDWAPLDYVKITALLETPNLTYICCRPLILSLSYNYKYLLWR
jgi:hypothetical protein